MITPEALLEQLNAPQTGWNHAMGLRFTAASADEVVASWTVGPEHLQPYGIVHGGVHCGVIEAVCSTGAAVHAMPSGASVVGLENQTSFLRAVRGGVLTVRATPLHRGRRSQVWEATVTDEQGRAVAVGRVRLLCLEAGAALAGQGVRIQSQND
ncbi:MAG: PaaI family thioesterase [Polyangiaceae bacterium]|nr:PaaI family thioesterase [Polyangiaceae bacterium]